MANLFNTPVFRGIPRYFPNIGSPEEMSPINDVTHDYENQEPPVIEVSPKTKGMDLNELPSQIVKKATVLNNFNI